MTITHIISTLAGGGAETLIKNTLPIYSQKGYDVNLILLSSKNRNNDYIKTLQDAQVKIKSCSNGSVYNPFLIIKLRKHLVGLKHVHVHLFPTLYWVALSKILFNLKVQLLYTEHSNKNKRREKYKFTRPLERLIYKQYKTLIAITDAVKNVLTNWTAHSNIKCINNGIDITHVNNQPFYERISLTNELALEQTNDRFLILMTGRFIDSKYQDNLIQNIIELKNDNIVLLLAGTGPLLDDLKTKYKSRSNIKFLGFRNDVISLMKSVDLNVLLTEYEGLSGVVLESLAAQKPFLGSNVIGVKDIVPDDSFLLNNNNSTDIQQKISQLLSQEELRKKIAKKGYSFVQKYDIKIMIQKHLELYKELESDKSIH